MNARIGLAAVLAVATTLVFLLAGRIGSAAPAPDAYAGGHFSFKIGATAVFLATARPFGRRPTFRSLQTDGSSDG